VDESRFSRGLASKVSTHRGFEFRHVETDDSALAELGVPSVELRRIEIESVGAKGPQQLIGESGLLVGRESKRCGQERLVVS
jgi:hypothetical protein